MHSFNDIHDLNDAGRASHSTNSINSTTSNRTTLLLPVELKCNPVLSLSSSIDSTVIRPSVPSDGGATQFSAFLPVARVPLILADAGRPPGGSSEFQCNAVPVFDSNGCITDTFGSKANGLRLGLNRDNRTSEAATSTKLSRSRSPSIDDLFPDYFGLSTRCVSLEEPFDEYGNITFAPDLLFDSSSYTDRNFTSTSTHPSYDVLASSYGALERPEPPVTSVNGSPKQLFGASSSLKGLSAFTGLVADINMFDKDSGGTICVKPEDLMGQITTREPQQPESPMSIKMEDTFDDPIEPIASPSTSPKYLKAPEPDWPQIPSEHLPFLVERYLAHFTATTTSEEAENSRQVVNPTMLPDPSAQPYTPITAEILDAVEEPRPVIQPVDPRRKLADKTNIPKARTGSRTGGNVMDMYEFLVPQDIIPDKAYEGVPVATVVQKTKYFLMMHPGERLSEELLFSFAGRLNTSGQQMPGYRCYLQGCSKTTKRKDHMADHVRTHLGEKPFQCSVCGMGFIRNNDCQRHENNHRPDKKFVCTCKAAFSRRDLFVRHQKTVCTMSQGSAISGCFRRPRKYNKAPGSGREGTPDGDDANDSDYIPGGHSYGVAGF